MKRCRSGVMVSPRGEKERRGEAPAYVEKRRPDEPTMTATFQRKGKVMETNKLATTAQRFSSTLHYAHTGRGLPIWQPGPEGDTPLRPYRERPANLAAGNRRRHPPTPVPGAACQS